MPGRLVAVGDRLGVKGRPFGRTLGADHAASSGFLAAVNLPLQGKRKRHRMMTVLPSVLFLDARA